MTTITATDQARAMGREARRSGEDRAPALSAPLMKMLEGVPVGEARTIDLMLAFTAGWDEGYPRQQHGDPHEHDWRDLGELDGKHRNYYASYCSLCGATMID